MILNLVSPSRDRLHSGNSTGLLRWRALGDQNPGEKLTGVVKSLIGRYDCDASPSTLLYIRNTKIPYQIFNLFIYLFTLLLAPWNRESGQQQGIGEW